MVGGGGGGEEGRGVVDTELDTELRVRQHVLETERWTQS